MLGFTKSNSSSWLHHFTAPGVVYRLENTRRLNLGVTQQILPSIHPPHWNLILYQQVHQLLCFILTGLHPQIARNNGAI